MPHRYAVMLVASVIALAWWFVPPPAEIVNRLVKDGNLDRAQEVAVEAQSHSGAAVPVSVIETWRALRDQQTTKREDARLILVNLILAAAGEKRADWIKEMMRDGAEVLQDATDDEVRKLVAGLRAGDQAGMAADWLGAAYLPGERAMPDDLVEVRIACLLELNRPGEALDLLIGKLKAGAEVPDLALLDRAVQAAEFSGRVDAVRPFVAQWLEASPFMRGPLEAFCAARPPAASAELNAFLSLGCKQAQWFEWSDQPEPAMPLYLRLALLGDAYAQERVMFLYEPLRQPLQMLTVLDALQSRHALPDALTRERARVLGMVGREKESLEAMRQYLAGHPGDAPLWGDFGSLLEDMGQGREALGAFQKAAAAAPDDVDLHKHLADLACAEGRYDLALEVYRGMSPEAHDSTTLESYALIAEALSNDAERHHALALRLERLAAPLPADFLELARSFQTIGDAEGRLETLRHGLAGHPRERRLIRALAEGYLDAERPADAASLIASDGSFDDPRQLCLFIEASSRAVRGRDALAVIGGVPGFDLGKLPPDTRLHYARLRLQAGDAEGAASALNGVTATAGTYALLAELEFDLGDITAARVLQLRHLATVGAQLPDSWMFLGDIERANGDEKAAAAAFERALTLIREKARVSDQTVGSTARVSTPALRVQPRVLFQ